MSANSLASNPVYHPRTKHIELDVHFIRDKVLAKELEVRYVPTTDQIADLMTKEMSPYNYRGTFNVCFQLMITVGILVANLFNYFFAKIEGVWGWRLSLGLAEVPDIIIIISSFFFSDTPNSLVDRGREEEKKKNCSSAFVELKTLMLTLMIFLLPGIKQG
ncbi:Sugar transport protein 1 [Abeliophyllum distichum]|uniref:Sugar transport protein 1 n=1 Tax=Abeliophyllum distichum TaxID=126358 RepID=A0ABD1V2M3_9LAMI